MKKPLLVVTILLCSINIAIAQNYCNDVVKYTDNGLINFKTPMPAMFKNTGHDFLLWKTISPKDSSTQMYLYASLTKSFADYRAKGFKVELEDGTILNFPDAELNCEYKPTLSRYLFHAQVPLTKADMENFKNKKLKSYIPWPAILTARF